MYFELYFKECKTIFKSFIYVAFLGVVILFHVLQLGNFAGYDIDTYYYFKSNKIFELDFEVKDVNAVKKTIIKNNKEKLREQYNKNEYIIFPEAFNIKANLNESDQLKIKQILNKLEPLENVDDFDKFKECMLQVQNIITVDKYSINDDKITGAYARYFCDTMGIAITMCCIFVVVSYAARDSKKSVNELAYTKKMKTSKIIVLKYLSVVTMIIAPIILLSLIPTIQFIVFSIKTSIPIDGFAFIKYILFWLIPSVLFITSFGIFVTMLRNNFVAIVLQFAYSFFCYIMTNEGHYSFEISLRSNSFFNLAEVQNSMTQIIINRSLYTVLAILLLFATIKLFDLKRKGLK